MKASLLSGENGGSSVATRAPKIDFERAQRLRADYAAGGVTQFQLAVRYELSPAAVNLIVNHKIYPEGRPRCPKCGNLVPEPRAS